MKFQIVALTTGTFSAEQALALAFPCWDGIENTKKAVLRQMRRAFDGQCILVGGVTFIARA